MSAGTSIEQRSIVLIPFPYTDLSGSKKRPALVISSSDFNFDNEDVICCLITSKPEETKHSIKITNKDMETGNLEFESKVKAFRIFTVNKKLIYRILGKLNLSKTRQIIDEINDIITV